MRAFNDIHDQYSDIALIFQYTHMAKMIQKTVSLFQSNQGDGTWAVIMRVFNQRDKTWKWFVIQNGQSVKECFDYISEEIVKTSQMGSFGGDSIGSVAIQGIMNHSLYDDDQCAMYLKSLRHEHPEYDNAIVVTHTFDIY